MGTAVIQLKFVSLVKNKSKCCVEIVPDICSIKNIDKIKWKKKIDSIEYVVPVTYKIVLKKSNFMKLDEEEKVYHSCVDLLDSKSIANLNSRRSLMRTLSEQFFERKINNIDARVKISKPLLLECGDRDIETELKTNVVVAESKHSYIDGIEYVKEMEDINVSRNNNDCTKIPLHLTNLEEIIFSQSIIDRKNIPIADLVNSRKNLKHNVSVATLTSQGKRNLSNTLNMLTYSPVCKITKDKLTPEEVNPNISYLQHIGKLHGLRDNKFNWTVSSLTHTIPVHLIKAFIY
ncbi:unnamed protein product, partial [Leptidea sinapis]